MSVSERELRRRIVADRNNNELRLVYADHWEETGDLERAELIRLELELELERERGLLIAKRARRDWLVHFCAPGWSHPDGVDWSDYRRGLIGLVCGDPRALVDGGEAIASTYPIEHLVVMRIEEASDPALAELADSPITRGLEHLDLRFEGPWSSGVRRLLERIDPEPIAAIDVWCDWMSVVDAIEPCRARSLLLAARSHEIDRGGEVLTRLADVDGLHGLESLELRGWSGNLGAGLHALSAAGRLAGLEHLELFPFREAEIDVSALATATSLTSLSLDSCGLDDDSIASLVRLPALERLILCNNALGAGAIAAIAATPVRERLVELDLSVAMLADGAAAPLWSSGAPRLQKLTLIETEIDETDAERLLAAHLPSLRALILDRNPLGPALVERLAASPLDRQLVHLGLEQTGVDNDGLARLAAAAPPLESLDLGRNPIDDRGLDALIDSPLIDSLATLSIAGTRVTDAGMSRLLDRAGGLCKLSVRYTGVSEQMVARLEERFILE